MPPRFSLPPAEPGAKLNLATKPKQVDAWLARLPYANPVEAAAEMADFLATCVRIRLAPDRLEEVLDRVLPTALQLVGSLRERFAGDSLPLAPMRHQAAELCVRLLLEMGHVCKLIVLERLVRRFPLFAAKASDKAVYVLLVTLQQVIEVSLDTHTAPPAGVWGDLHQAYAHTMNNAWTGEPPLGLESGASPHDIYAVALLHALSDPFRTPREEAEAVKRLIHELAPLTEFVPGNEASRHGSAFAIDPESDTPVIVLARAPEQAGRQSLLLLNTTLVVKRLALLASQQARERRPARGTHQDLARLELINRLKAQWGGAVQRVGNRRARYEMVRYEVLFGFQTIHRLLAPEPDARMRSPYQSDAAPAECLLLNDSVGGVALARERPVGFQLRIGEVAALRALGVARWSIGIVRWFRATRTGKAVFGLQLLAPGASGVTLYRDEDGAEVACLWLPATPSMRLGESLLCPAGCVGIGTRLAWRDAAGGERGLRLDQLVEFTPSLESYRFSG